MSFRVGLVGAGWISRVHAAALERVPEGRVTGVCARTASSARRFAEERGLAVATTELSELLPHVDVVCVNSPNAWHARHAVAAARAGKHVIVEKPLAVSLEEGRGIVDACAEAGVGLAYAEELPFVPRFVRAKEILGSGEIGDPVYVTQREAHAGPESPWFFAREEAGGGVLMDMACHSVECVRWLLDKRPVRRVTARLARTRHAHRTELEDHAVLHLEFEGGATALCEASWALLGGMQSRLEVWGTRGVVAADLLQETGVRVFREGARGALGTAWSAESADWLGENGYPQELQHFLRCFAEGREPRESGADGLAVLEILTAAYTSARESRTLDLR